MPVDSETTGLTDEQVLLMRTASRFADEQRAPGGGRRSEGHVMRAWGQLALLGLIGIAAPEDIGGLGGSCVDEAIVAAAIGRGMVPIAYSPIATTAVHLLSSAPLGQDIVRQILSGKRLVTVADDEPGMPLGSPPSTALVRRNGAYRLIGNKELVLGLDQAGSILVTARAAATNETVIVWLNLQDRQLRPTPLQMLDGRTAYRLEIDIDIEGTDILMRGNQADVCLEAARDRAAVINAAEMVGAMQGVLALTREHLRTRRQFGKPLSALQALRHRFADMVIETECSESAMFAAADACADPARRRHMAAVAKAKCSRAGVSVGEAAIQLHGALGVADESEIGHYYKRLIVLNALHGSRDDQLDRLAERYLQHRAVVDANNSSLMRNPL